MSCCMGDNKFHEVGKTALLSIASPICHRRSGLLVMATLSTSNTMFSSQGKHSFIDLPIIDGSQERSLLISHIRCLSSSSCNPSSPLLQIMPFEASPLIVLDQIVRSIAGSMHHGKAVGTYCQAAMFSHQVHI